MAHPVSVELEASEGSKWACKDKLESQKGSVAGNGGSQEEKSSPASWSTKTGHVENGHCIPGGQSLMRAAGWLCPSTHAPEQKRGVQGGREEAPQDGVQSPWCWAGVGTAQGCLAARAHFSGTQ